MKTLKKVFIKRALGFEYDETKTYISKDEKGKKITRVEKTTKQALPDTGACFIALKNLAGDKWKDKSEHTITTNKELEDAYKE